jgi:hypothetical protein
MLQLRFARQTDRSLGPFSSDVLVAWLRTQDVFVDEHVELSYNNAYHFYDFKLFPGGNETSHVLLKRVLQALKANNHKVTFAEVIWRWDKVEDVSIRVEGIRVWVEAE